MPLKRLLKEVCTQNNRVGVFTSQIIVFIIVTGLPVPKLSLVRDLYLMLTVSELTLYVFGKLSSEKGHGLASLFHSTTRYKPSWTGC